MANEPQPGQAGAPERQPLRRTVDPAQYYEGIWKTDRDDMKKHGPFSRHYRRLFMSLIRPLAPRSILDVGCGQGSLLAELRSEFPTCALNGIDVSASALDLARQKVPTARFWDMDITRETLTEQFDLVICSEVLEHVPDDVAILKNLALVTGRYLVISTVQGRMRGFEPKIGHVRNYAPGELVQKVEQAGFRVIRCIEWGFPFYSPLYRDFLDLVGGRGTTGEFGLMRRAISETLYYLFMLNSSRRGDEILVLAEPVAQAMD